jgi:hypothetical protein
MDTEPNLHSLLARLDAERERLRGLLEGNDIAVLARRPPSGKWSILENVQHLLFAEREHLGRRVAREQDWSEFGLVEVLPRKQKRLRLDNADGGFADKLLDAWMVAHAALAPRLAEMDSPEFRHRLARHITHQRTHIKEIERLSRGGR